MLKELNKDFKETAIGLIPNDWEVKKLGDIIDYKKGFAFKTNSYKLEGVRLIRVSDTNSQGIKKEGDIFIDIEEAKKYVDYQLLENDIIIQTVGSRPPMYDSMVGKTILVNKEFEGSLLNQNAVRLREKNGNNYFLFSLFRRKSYFDFIETLVRGNANQVSITLEDLFKYLIPYPKSVPEQQKIAKILSTWDEAIDQCKRIIAELKVRNKGFSQQLLTGKMRVKGFGEDLKNEYFVAGNYINEVSLKNRNIQIKRVLSVTNSRGFINQTEQFDREVASADLSNYKIVKKNQFAYNPSRVNVGSLDLLKTFEEGILSPMYVVFETDNKKLLPDFFHHHLKTHWFRGHIPMFVQGSVRDSLSYDGLCGMKFFIPPLEEQKTITTILDKATEELHQYQRKLENLQLQKKGLMQQLLTGKVRVKYN